MTLKKKQTTCKICFKNCKSSQNLILCDRWPHQRCTSLTSHQFAELGNSNLVYFIELNTLKMNLIGQFNHLLTDGCEEIERFAEVQNECHNRRLEWFDSKLNDTNLSLLHLNARSLPKNKYLIEEMLYELKTKPDVIAITETRLNERNENNISL